MSYITNAAHFLDDNGNIGPKDGAALKIAEFFASAISYATCPQEERRSITCFNCSHSGISALVNDADKVEWVCDGCGENGVISNWRETHWDMTATSGITSSHKDRSGKINMSMFDSKKAIMVGLDPSYILMCITMWRDALDMKISVHDSIKLHFIANRRVLLEGYQNTAKAWCMLLGTGSMQAEGGHQSRLAEVIAKVEEFRSWAKAGLDELDQIAAVDQSEI